jgi:tRNA(fMet)-specific endonuclease VapC
MTTFVLDTNIISYYLKGREPVANNIAGALMQGHNVIIAPIAYYEIKRGLMAVNAQKRLQAFDMLCELLGVGQFNNDMLDAAAEIYVAQRRTGHAADDADIFIAAYCISRQCTLVTNNIRHFEHIPDLTLLDWTLSGK